MASIRKRGDKWQVQIRRIGAPNLSRTFNFKSDAVLWARQIEREADRGGLDVVDTRQLRHLTVKHLIERYRDTVVVRKRSCDVETYILNAILRQSWVHLTLAALKPDIFAKYRDKRLLTVKPATVQRELCLLQHMFEIAREEWGVPLSKNPLAPVKKPRVGPTRERRIGHTDWERLTRAAASCRNKYILPLMCFALATGMRRGELLRLNWSEVDTERRTVLVASSKNGHARTIPLAAEALDVLRSMPNDPGRRVFPTTADAVKLAWRRLRDRAGVSDVRFHDLRHEAISRFFERGLSVPEVALISGHKDARMLFRYTHMQAQDIAAKLNDEANASNVVPIRQKTIVR